MTFAAMVSHRRSSKNRRKAERKKVSLREGSAHEEEALVGALKEIVATVDRLQEDVRDLLHVLVQFGFMKEASAAQRSFVELVDTVKLSMASIWPPSAPPAVGVADIQVGSDPAIYNYDIVSVLNIAKVGSWGHCQ